MAEHAARLETLITTFVQEITRAARDAAREVLLRELGVGDAPIRLPARAPTPRRKSRPARTIGRRSPLSIDATKQGILAAITKAPGQRSEELRAALGHDRATFQLPLRKLVAEGAVAAKGVKRATRYYPGSRAR